MKREVRTAGYYVAGVVDKDILPCAMVAVDDGHGPHLTAQEVQAFDHRIGEAIEGDSVRAAGVIGCVFLLFDPLVPVIAVSVEGTDTMAIDTDVIPAEHKRCGLVLVAIRNRCVKPVLDVGTPLEKR